ncbi:hypothetical protein MCC93_12880 [Morococcus cerebrosus]|uniref:Uncharacterized protein n=1 Tax=Morococcus cerebrosus TaxID=1056807 RepID=A0A0C1GNF1_9NEIS|nr:hypothetical protein MCC93_12880 [Morococcus cerebrosus]
MEDIAFASWNASKRSSETSFQTTFAVSIKIPYSHFSDGLFPCFPSNPPPICCKA